MSEKWEVRMYQSGTHIVTRNISDKPHYYVYGDDRQKVCNELCDWLNGGSDPLWRSELVRTTEESVDGPSGIHIYVTGPFVLPKDDDGALNWEVDIDKKQERIELIDLLLQ